MDKLIKHGRVIRGALGISGEPINQVVAQILNLPDMKGVLVTGVDPEAPAARAGLAPRDVITQYNGEDVPGVEMLLDRIAETPPGTRIDMVIIREGKTQTLPGYYCRKN
ncbi:PDZ domain-containing protein [Paucibacter sp. O1-1]|nr:PDZ domain-containing protein [Paucibacter sp. O1-1]MDA3824336.1 PDZ domain-containing protein [Paucibacter sp. O1-1]